MHIFQRSDYGVRYVLDKALNLTFSKITDDTSCINFSVCNYLKHGFKEIILSLLI